MVLSDPENFDESQVNNPLKRTGEDEMVIGVFWVAGIGL